jgi:hypothetical protein
MKRLVFFVILVSLTFHTSGQDYEPTTKWPYLNKNFQKGTFYLNNGHTTEKEANIHLFKSALHYVENDVIQELSNTRDVDSIRIAAKTYVYIGNEIYQVLKQIDSNNGLYLLALGNFDNLAATTGAYGVKSHTSAVTKYNSLDLGGLTERNFIKLTAEKDDGKFFPIHKTYYFKINGKLIKANKKDLEKEIESPQIKERLRQYLKKNKVKWNKADSLAELFGTIVAM